MVRTVLCAGSVCSAALIGTTNAAPDQSQREELSPPHIASTLARRTCLMTAPAPVPSSRPSWADGLALLGSFLLAALTALLMMRGGFVREAAFMAGIFVLAALLWMTEALPLWVTSLLVIGLQALLLANPGGWSGLGFATGDSPTFRQILSTAADPVLVLFFGGFVLAQAAVNEGVDRSMSALLLRPFGNRPRWVLLGLMLVTLLFSAWMSNTATAAMMLALAAPMAAALPPNEKFRKALILAIPVAANLGGMATPISSPPNAIAIGFLRDAGHTVPFYQWVLVGAPLATVLTLIGWALLLWFFPPDDRHLRIHIPPARLTGRGWFVVSIFSLTVLLWMSDQWHGLPPSLVALFPVVVLSAARIFTSADLARIEWRVLILIAGGISLGTGMQLSGLDKVIVSAFPESLSGAALLMALMLANVAIGSFISNTAVANLFLPIAISTAALGALHPVQAALAIALASSVAMALPISTPPNALAYASGVFTRADLLKTGLLLSALAIALIFFVAWNLARWW